MHSCGDNLPAADTATDISDLESTTDQLLKIAGVLSASMHRWGLPHSGSYLYKMWKLLVESLPGGADFGVKRAILASKSRLRIVSSVVPR